MHFSAIVAIGWIYVTLLMALAQDSVLAGIGTFVFYGLLPMVILVYLFTTGIRRRRRRALEEAEEARSKTAPSDDSSSPS
jgi:type VI protein secretion system component VasK